MTAPWLVAGGVVLRNQMDERFPNRDKTSDGWIGDAAHQSRPSYHNPDAKGAVHAVDFDEGFGAKGDNMRFANQLLDFCRQRRPGYDRILHVVYEDRVASGTYANSMWTWRGSGYGHTEHIHISFSTIGEHDDRPFDIPILLGYGWDGIIPSMFEIERSIADPTVRNRAAFRMANRLHDLGFYDGDVKPLGEQGYPKHAVKAWQDANGYGGNGAFGPKGQVLLFGAPAA